MDIIQTGLPAQTEPYFKILAYFYSFPGSEVTLNQLASKVKVSKTSATKAVLRLVKEGFLHRKVIGRSWQLSCNQRHEYNHSRKIAFFLAEILDSDLVDKINRAYPSNKAIVLFGSYRKGDSIETSDLDIAVEVIGNLKTKVVPFGTFERLGDKKNVPINLHLFSRKNVSTYLFANIANGIVLDGFLEVGP